MYEVSINYPPFARSVVLLLLQFYYHVDLTQILFAFPPKFRSYSQAVICVSFKICLSCDIDFASKTLLINNFAA